MTPSSCFWWFHVTNSVYCLANKRFDLTRLFCRNNRCPYILSFFPYTAEKMQTVRRANWLNRPRGGIQFCVYVPPSARFVADSGRPQPKLWRRSTAAGCSVTFRPLQSKQSMSFTQKATVDTPRGGCGCVCVYSVILCLVMDSCQQRDGAAERGVSGLDITVCTGWAPKEPSVFLTWRL